MLVLELYFFVIDNVKYGLYISYNLLIEIYDNWGKIIFLLNCVDFRSSFFFLGFGICIGVEIL